MLGLNKPAVMVTGAAGYLGIPVVAELVRRQYPVVAVDADLCGTLSALTRFERVHVRRQDFRLLQPADLKGIRAVIHLAGLPNDPVGDLFSEAACIQINGHAVGELAAKADKAGCERFVFMSTCSVYGATEGDDQWVNEDSPVDPISAYARGKVVGEKSLLDVAPRNLSTVIVRGATLCGVSPFRMRFDLPIHRFCMQAHACGRVFAVAPKLWRPFVSVVDAASALVSLMECSRERVDGKTFNLGASQWNWRIGEVAEMIAKAFSADVIEVPLGRDSRSYRVSCDRLAASVPEAIPQISMEETIQTIRYALRCGWFVPTDTRSEQCNAQNGYRALLATDQMDPMGFRRLSPFGIPEP